ncbi:MAG: sensor histidine kinase [Pseudomonadota bacterium]
MNQSKHARHKHTGLFEALGRISWIGTADRAKDLVQLVAFYGAGVLVWWVVAFEVYWFTRFGSGSYSETAWVWSLFAFVTITLSIAALFIAASYLGYYRYPFKQLYRHKWIVLAIVLLYLMMPVLAASVNSVDVDGSRMLMPLVTLAPLAGVLRLPLSMVLIVFSTAGVAAFYSPDLAPVTAAYAVLQQVVLLLMTRAVSNEKFAKEDLLRRNDELGATQALLSESSRQNERLRIARNIHDLVGHHVAALALNLEVLSHKTEGETREEIKEALGISRDLMDQVRSAVSEYRMDVALPVADILSELITHAPRLEIDLDLDESLVIRDSATAETILRSAQEIVTNTLKHSEASQLFMQLRTREGWLQFLAIDNGGGPKHSVKMGNGLTGISERVESLGGSMNIDQDYKDGFKVSLRIPLPESVA